MKQVDTNEYVSMLKGLVEEGHTVSMLISGSSMAPFLIHQRDTVWFRAPDREPRTGDMVFYRRQSGQYVLHRICRVKKDGYYLIGDNQTQVEGPLHREQIFALVVKVRRKGKDLEPGSFWWEFFARVWPRVIPLRRWILTAYGLIFHR